jgi:putative FmdB family regulatory protein
MPVYRYEVKEGVAGCRHCQNGFEVTQSMRDDPLASCPECGARIVKTPVAAQIGRSQSKLDDRAKEAGFTKLKRLGKGEYEKEY